MPNISSVVFRVQPLFFSSLRQTFDLNILEHFSKSVKLRGFIPQPDKFQEDTEMEVLNDGGFLVRIQKLLNWDREIESLEDSGNVGPILARDFRKAADAFNSTRFLKLAVIGGLFKREVFKALKVGLVLFPYSLANGFGIHEIVRFFAEDNLSTPVF